jgi:hypothetical protein
MPNRALRCDFIGGSDARIIMGGPARAVAKQAQMRAEAGREDRPLGGATKDPSRRWCQAITGRIPIGWYVVAVCYATAGILLGWAPWNVLLLLLLFPIRNNRVRFYEFRTVAAKESMRSRQSRKLGGSL